MRILNTHHLTELYGLTFAAIQIVLHVASCNSTLACSVGNDACACCPHGAGEYNVSYDSTSGVCTVSGSDVHGDQFASRPWTGRLIRDAEGLIFFVCAVLMCGLLCRAVRDDMRHLHVTKPLS